MKYSISSSITTSGKGCKPEMEGKCETCLRMRKALPLPALKKARAGQEGSRRSVRSGRRSSWDASLTAPPRTSVSPEGPRPYRPAAGEPADTGGTTCPATRVARRHPEHQVRRTHRDKNCSPRAAGHLAAPLHEGSRQE